MTCCAHDDYDYDYDYDYDDDDDDDIGRAIPLSVDHPRRAHCRRRPLESLCMLSWLGSCSS